MFAFRELLERRKRELAEILTSEHGKVLPDALGEVNRGLEVVEFACGLAQLTKGEFSEIADTAKVGMLGTFKAQPGFIRYGVADTGGGTLLAISLWETRSQAESSAPVATATPIDAEGRSSVPCT